MAEKKIDKRQASRQSLISAAASAEKSQTKAQALGIQTGVGTFIQRKKEYDKKRKELEDAANKSLNTDINEKEEKEKMEEDIKRDRDQYVVEITPGGKEKILATTAEKVKARQDFMNSKSDISEIFLDEMEYDGDNFIYDQIKEFIEGKAIEEVDSATGEATILFQDGEDVQRVPLNQFKQEVEKLKIDRDSQKNLTALVDDITNLADNQQSTNFDYVKYQNKVSQIINNKDTSLYSLANHKLINGNSFKDHMTEALSKGTYEDLGLSTAKAEELDPTPNTPITPEDANKITQALIQDSDMLKEYLVKYYTDVLQLQYNVNLPKAQVNTSKNTVTAENTNTNNKTNNQKKGPLNTYDPNTTTL